MPGDEVEDGTHKIDNYSQGRYLSQTEDSRWRVFDHNQWIGKQGHFGPSQSSDLSTRNYRIQQLDSAKGHDTASLSFPLDLNLRQLIPGSGPSINLSGLHQLNANGLLFGNQHFQATQNHKSLLDQNPGYNQLGLTNNFSVFESQHENDPRDSPTLTTNSERSEITEASTDFSFNKGYLNNLSDQGSGLVQPSLMQQSEYTDMQLLQQHIMFKKLQDLQRQQQFQQLGDVRQQQFQQLGDVRQQNSLNGGQFSPLINGTPVHDTSQMYMNWVQRGASPASQGASNRVTFLQEQGQVLHGMGMVPQQLDASLYGTPVSGARGNMSQYSSLQGVAQDSMNLLSRTADQAQKSIFTGFSNNMLNDQYNVCQDQVFMPQGAFIPNLGSQGKSTFGTDSVQGLNNEFISRSFPSGTTSQTSESAKDFHGRRQGDSWSDPQQKNTQSGPSQCLVPLDPIEEKILFDMDNTTWDASFGRHPDMCSGGFGNALDNTDPSDAFPAVQNGSWSALMQSAVAEASSSDTGIREEWSGLTCQNTEAATQIPNFNESNRQHTGWANNNLPSAYSLSPKPMLLFNDSRMGSGTNSFQQPSNEVSDKQMDGTHESVESPSGATGDWISRNSQSYMHLGNVRAGQMHDHSNEITPKGNTRFSREDTQFSDCAALSKSSAPGASNQQIPDNNQSININGNKSVGNNDPLALYRSSEGRFETCEKQENSFSKETLGNNQSSSEFNGHEQGNLAQMKIFGDVTGLTMSLDKGPVFEGNSKALETMHSRGDFSFVGSPGLNSSAQTSQNMLELIHKVDQTREDGAMTHIDSTSLSEMPNLVDQMSNQSSDSQGFGLKLAPPSPWLPNSNRVLSQCSPQTLSYLNSNQANAELGERNYSRIASETPIHLLPPSHNISQGSHWDNRSGTPGQRVASSPFSTRLSSVASLTSGRTFVENQLPMKDIPERPQLYQSSLETLPNIPNEYSPLSLFDSQDVSQQNSTTPIKKQFPVFETVPESQPSDMSMSGKVEGLTRPHNVWTNVPSWRHPSSHEPPNAPSRSPVDLSDNSIINPTKVQQQSPGVLDASLTSGLYQGKESPAKQFRDENGTPSKVLLDHAHQSDPDGVRPADSYTPPASARNFARINHSMESPQINSVPHQMHAVNHAEADQSIKKLRTDNALDAQRVASSVEQNLYGYNSTIRLAMDSGLQSPAQLSFCPSQLSFKTVAKEGQSVKVSQPTFQDTSSRTMAALGQNAFLNHSSSSNVISSHIEQGQFNITPQFFTPCIRSRQVLPMYVGNSSQNFLMNTHVEQSGFADAIQGPSVRFGKANTDHFSAPYVLPSDIKDQNMAIMRPKKRKSNTSERLAWHKEVMQSSGELQNISMTEQEWAEATSRLFDKVENEVQMTETMQQPMLQSKKRRLILTTQLMQQLLRPTPSSFLSAKATSHYDSVLYCVSRVAVGDACNLSYFRRNNLITPLEKSPTIPDKLETLEESSCQKYSEGVKEMTERTKKLESEFQRLDQAASTLDTRMEFQDLERFGIINRFAMFHSRGAADTFGNSSSSGIYRPVPQRRVSVIQMPKNLPEGAPCLSL